jgi:ketosteroid isomerase-like protein
VSQENVEIVSRFVHLYNEQDLDGAIELCSADVDVTPATVFPEGEPIRGRDAYLLFLQDTWEAWDGGVAVIREILEAPGDRVVVRVDWRARGLRSGLDVSTDLTAVMTLGGGKIVATAYFFKHADALKAVGLEE